MKMTESAENTQVSSAFGQRRWAAVEAMRAVEAQTGPEPRSACRQALCSQARAQPLGASASLTGKNTERNDPYSLRVRFEAVGTRHLDQSPGCPAMRGTHDPPRKDQRPQRPPPPCPMLEALLSLLAGLWPRGKALLGAGGGLGQPGRE